jgi:RHS repeat-associated protein
VGAFGFAGSSGYQEDSDSSLKLLGHRYYDPSSGRFLTRDPAKAGRNWYAYCGNNPLGMLDATGLMQWVIGYAGDYGGAIYWYGCICHPFAYKSVSTRQQLTAMIVDAPPGSDFGYFGHGRPDGGLMLTPPDADGDAVWYTPSDIDNAANQRAAAGKGKLSSVSICACWSLQAASDWSKLANNVYGYPGPTASAHPPRINPIQGSPSPPSWWDRNKYWVAPVAFIAGFLLAL